MKRETPERRDRHCRDAPGERWRHGSIAAHVAWILLLGLLAVFGVGLFVHLHDRELTAATALAGSVADRIGATAELLEATPADRHAELLRALNSPFLWVRRQARPPTAAARQWRHAEVVRAALTRNLPARWRAAAQVQVPERRRPANRAAPLDGPPAGLLDARRSIVVALPQPAGEWLVFTAAADVGAPHGGVRALLWTVLTALLALTLAVAAAHRLTRPLRRFAAAADRLGVDTRAAPLPEQGSRELRNAASAFNRMQLRLQRLIDDRTRVLAAVAHDLRTALTRLRLRTEFIDDCEQRAKAVVDLDQMQAMLEATLTFARDDSQAEPRTALDLAALLHSLCDDLADAGRPARCSAPPRLSLQGRPVALRRVFANLIDNALAYGRCAEVAVAEQGDEVVVRVCDRGPGIPEELREKVFEPFFRLEGSRSRATGGAGLGLAVARTLVRRQGGDVTLGPRPGGGLEVSVSLPRVPAP